MKCLLFVSITFLMVQVICASGTQDGQVVTSQNLLPDDQDKLKKLYIEDDSPGGFRQRCLEQLLAQKRRDYNQTVDLQEDEGCCWSCWSICMKWLDT